MTLDYPLIIVINDPVTSNEEIGKVMEMAAEQKRPLLVFSTDMQDGPLSVMLYNAKKDTLGSCAVNIPFMAGKEEEFIQDIAVICGAKIIKNDGMSSYSLDNISFDMFGSAAKVHISEGQTQIIGGAGTSEELDKHRGLIQHQIEHEESKHFKKIMRDRLTRLNQMQAIIGVGGETEAVIGENRDLIVDSLNSARASLESGVLPGGGISLYHASKLLPVYADIAKADENVGIKIFQESLTECVRKIIGNAIGEERVGRVLEKIDAENDYLSGYNVRSEKIENMIEAGVLDSYKVIKSVIEDSVNLSNMVIMTE